MQWRANPDLQIRGEGGGGGHPDPQIGGGRSQKNFFRPFGSQFDLKIRGPPGPSPGSAAEMSLPRNTEENRLPWLL